MFIPIQSNTINMYMIQCIFIVYIELWKRYMTYTFTSVEWIIKVLALLRQFCDEGFHMLKIFIRYFIVKL